MRTFEKHPLPIKDFESLAKAHHTYCISIFLPMDKKGKEQNMHLAQALLKQCIGEVQSALAEHQLHEDEIAEYLEPVLQLIDEAELWRNPSDGMAIFLNPVDGIRYFRLPLPFEVKTYVAGHFYLLPLLGLYHNDGLYYLLELSQDYVRLYKASRYGFKDQHIEDFAPNKLEEAVGFDHKPKMLQFRSGQDVHGAGSFHGHGEGKDDLKKELVSFFSAIDKGVLKAIEDKKAPLVVACVDYLFDLFHGTTTYPNIFGTNISGDPEFRKKTDLHQESWNLVESYFKTTQAEMLTKFKELYHTQKTSYEIEKILEAAFNGRINTLFIENDTDIFGTYDIESCRVDLDDQRALHNVSLTNLVALKTFENGGKVYFLTTEEMPVVGSSIVALFRF